MSGRDLGIEVGDDVFAMLFVEVLRPGVFRFAFLILADLDEKRVPAAKHVLDDAAGPRDFGWIFRIKGKLRVAGADVKDADSS